MNRSFLLRRIVSCSDGVTRLMSTSVNKDLVLVSSRNNVTQVTMNNPRKLNGWTLAMLDRLIDIFAQLSTDDDTKVTRRVVIRDDTIMIQVMILTGTDPYYSAGANLSENITPMHPRYDRPVSSTDHSIISGPSTH